MSADAMDNLPYRPDNRMPDATQRRHYWAVAIGLQEVDGLKVSSYARELASGYVSGIYDLADTRRLLLKRHAHSSTSANPQDPYLEADLVSQRIAEVLADGSFFLAPGMLAHIHRHLFQDLDASVYRPGGYKEQRLVKQEEILNGDSVLYADPSMIEMPLNYLFQQEAMAARGTNLTGKDLTGFCRFVAHIWQVHPFVEGNTRTIAVFSELYLSSLGFLVGNKPFEHHARYFRDALVRANYRNPQADIAPEFAFLEAFYDNLVNAAAHPLVREDLVCPQLFDNPSLLKNIDPTEALH